MPVVPYTPGLFSLVRDAVRPITPDSNLLHQPFVDYYYATREWCRLYVVLNDSESVEGVLGAESIELECDGVACRATVGSNYYSCRRGGTAPVTRKIIRSSPLLLTYGGSSDSHHILRKFRYVRYAPEVATYLLNRAYESQANESSWKKGAKWCLRNATRASLRTYGKQIPRQVRSAMEVREESAIAPDLMPAKSPFRLRLAPRLEYLNWRFRTGLPFVSYRIFRVLLGSRTTGYVVLNDGPSKIIVSHCDGDDPVTLAYGILLSILALGRNDEKVPVILSSSNGPMRKIFEQFGFVRQDDGRLFVFYGALSPLPALPPSPSWLINFEIGDNGLRVPFLDQAPLVSYASGSSLG